MDETTPTELSQQEILAQLEGQLTQGYKQTLPVEAMFGADGPIMAWQRDIEIMLRHPVVRQALGYFKGGISGAEFWGGPNPDDPEDEIGLPICPENDKVGRFIKEQCERFWDRGVPQVQAGYEYGWIGCENTYDATEGILRWENLCTFSPRDVYLLVQDLQPVGVRVKNVRGQPKPVDLWAAGETIPAKALWYAHQPRYGEFYGQSQLIGSWRPWRRAAWKDGAETILDGACYRFGYQGPIARYPDEDMASPVGIPNTTVDGSGITRRYARDIMRQIGEQYKAGGVVGLPSKRDAHGQYTYDLTLPTGTLVGLNGLIEYLDHLYNQITQGIGVPPELLEASETGSGYSGRRIPLEAFLANQQQIADAILKLFVEQILRPLVRWNFGDVKFDVKVKSLIKTRTKQARDENPQSDAQPAGANTAGQTDPLRNQQDPRQQQQDPRQQGRPQGQAMFSSDVATVISDRVLALAKKLKAA